MSAIDDIQEAIRPTIESTGNVLEEVTLTPDGSSRLLTVIVDNEKSLNLDEITVVTKAISEILDGVKVLGDTPFTLEVTTPGLDRPLRHERHWKKNRGRLVNVTLKSGESIKGRIGDLVESVVTIDEKRIQLSDIGLAMIEVEFKKVGE